jgi:hypothetical protein
VVQEHLARDGPGVLRMSCSHSGQGSAQESRATGTVRRTGFVNLGVSAGAWADDGRPGSAPESHIGEELGAAGDSGWAGGVTNGKLGHAAGDGDGRPGSAPELQIGEESGAAGDGVGRRLGGRRRTGLIFWKHTVGAAFQGIVAPVYSSRPTNAR